MENSAGAADLVAALDSALLRPLHFVVLLLTFVVGALDGLDAAIVGLAAPALASDFDLSRTALGPLFSAAMVGMASGAVLFGPLGDRYGRRTMLTVCVALFGIGTLVTVWAQNFQHLLLLRFLTGLGLGGALPNAVTLMAEFAPRRRRPLFVTLMYMGFPAGGVLGGMAAGPLMAAGGWQALFWLGGALPLALSPLLLIWLPESPLYLARRGADARLRGVLQRLTVPTADDRHWMLPADPAQSRPVELFRAGRTRNTLLLWTAFFINLLAIYFFMNWVPTLAVDRGVPLERALRVMVMFNLGAVGGSLVLAWLSAHYNPRRMLAAFYAGGAVAFMAIGVAAAWPAAMLLAGFITGAFVGGAQVGLFPLATRVYPTAVRVTGVGFAQAWGRVGSILAPLAGAAMVALSPPFAAYFLVFGAPLLLAAAAVAAMREAA